MAQNEELSLPVLQNTPRYSPPTRLQEVRGLLETMNDRTTCLFRHENSGSPTQNRCPARIADRRLGCAHSSVQRLLSDAVQMLQTEGMLTDEEAEAHRSALRAAQKATRIMEYTASRNYLYDDDPGQEVADGQRGIVDTRNTVRLDLLRRLERHFGAQS